MLADNDDLRAELEMYKSVAVHPDVKPRTTITRVARVPSSLAEPEPGASHTSVQTSALRSVSGSKLASVPETSGVNDMTLDEIM